MTKLSIGNSIGKYLIQYSNSRFSQPYWTVTIYMLHVRRLSVVGDCG